MNKKATYVKPSGLAASAKYVLVGEQPGRVEVLEREPFVGPSGRILDSCLASVGINRAECYVTNVIKDLDAPLEQYVVFKKSGVELSPEAQEYVALLREELEKTTARVIVAVGKVALYALTSRTAITKWRGSVLESTLLPGRLVIPCLHPATVLPPKRVYKNKRLIQFDLQKARLLVERGWKPKKRTYRTKPTFGEVVEYIANVASSGQPFAFDVEVINEELSCFSLAKSDTDGICCTFVADGVDVYTPEQETEIMRLLTPLVEGDLVTVGQNLTFDGSFCLGRYGIFLNPKKIEDTMIAQKILMPTYPKGLDFIASIHTTLPYYKEDGKKWIRVEGGSQEQFWVYNINDSFVCLEALPSLRRLLREQGNEETYEETKKVVGPLMYMMQSGVRVDVGQMCSLRDLFSQKVAELQQQLNELAGEELNVDSPKQMVTYFYTKKGYPPYKNKKTKGFSVDDDALTRLAIKGSEEAKIIRKMRSLGKLISTYLDVEKVDPDGRIRCSYDPCGTKFSRLSSSENIFGTGMNLQNWPHLLQLLMWVD